MFSAITSRYVLRASLVARTYILQLRHNGAWDPDEPVDFESRGWLEPPAKGIHGRSHPISSAIALLMTLPRYSVGSYCFRPDGHTGTLTSTDLTFEQAPLLITKHLKAQGQSDYLRPGYRFRIVKYASQEVLFAALTPLSTWRPLIPVIEDNPLAFCDSRSVDPSDLLLADRISPNDYYTLYFLKHNPEQRWHWVSNQTASEITLLLNYDSKAGGARCTSLAISSSTKLIMSDCAHGSFKNPLAPSSAPIRQSIETRSLVITRE